MSHRMQMFSSTLEQQQHHSVENIAIVRMTQQGWRGRGQDAGVDIVDTMKSCPNQFILMWLAQ